MTDIKLLQYIIDNDIIDLSSTRKEYEKMKRNDDLSKHKYDIWQGKNGKWYTYIPNEENGRKLVKRTTKEDVENVIIDHYKEKENNPDFKEVFNSWIDNKLNLDEIRKGTYDRYKVDYKKYFENAEINNTKIKSITDIYLEDVIRQTIVEFKLTQKAYANMRTIVIGIFKHAKRLGLTKISISSFFNDLELSKNVFKKNIKVKEDQVYLENEIPIIANYLKDNSTLPNLALLLAFQTGIRAGELSTLKFSDVLKNSIHVQRTEVKYRDVKTNKYVHDIKEFPKSEAGDRYVILTSSALETIKLIKDRNPVSDFMFEINGRRILANTFNDYLRNACKRCNINMKSMHKIRRTYGTTLIDSGVDESLIMEQMGHTDISTTKKFYYYSNKDNDSKMKQNEQAINI